MTKFVRILVFGALALVLLALGCIGAQALWQATHHRYDRPASGYYYGSVHAIFDGTDDDIYSFHFRGETQPHWRWVYSTNFIYRTLQFEWNRFDQGPESEGTGTLKLPSLAYESSHGTGVLTRAVLSRWLLGTTNRTPAALRSVDAVFGFLGDAGRGTLPAPNHHGHYFEEPVHGRIQHFSGGFGVGGPVYLWAGVWLLSVLFLAHLLFSRKYARA